MTFVMNNKVKVIIKKYLVGIELTTKAIVETELVHQDIRQVAPIVEDRAKA